MDFKERMVIGGFLGCRSLWGFSNEEASKMGGFDSADNVAALSRAFNEGGDYKYNSDQFNRMSVALDLATVIDALVVKGDAVAGILNKIAADGRVYKNVILSGSLSDLKMVFSELATSSE